MIYFIADIKNRVCKIGYSERPLRRLHTLQTAYPFELICIKQIEGNIDDEKLLHYKYKDCRLKGEWFDLDSIDEISKEITEKYYIEENVCNVLVKIDKLSGFYNATDFINKINEQKASELLPIFNLSSWINSNEVKIFISELEKQTHCIFKGSNTWVHKYIFHELTLAIGSKYKIQAYQYLINKSVFKV